MTRSLLFFSLVFWLCLSAIPSRTFAEPKADTKPLGRLFSEHKGGSIHGQSVHEKRKRSGRNYSSKRCNASEHSHGGNTPSSSQVSPNTSHPAAAAAQSKKWGLAWPNGDTSYLANFARPKVHLFEYSSQLPTGVLTLFLVCILGAPTCLLWRPILGWRAFLCSGDGNRWTISKMS